MKYIVQISELLSHSVEVEADTAEKARQQVMNDYYDGDIVLTEDDYVGGSLSFEVVGEEFYNGKN